MNFPIDRIIFSPPDVDLRRSPLRQGDLGETFVLGAFNPALTRLPNGNLLLMVRIAEALREPISGNSIRAIRWDVEKGYIIDSHDLATVDATDPRAFRLRGQPSRVMALTSLSWLLPVELSADGMAVVELHYDKAISPKASYQQYGVEDPRISKIDDGYFMTTCSVSAERQCTTLYTSEDGLNYQLQGIVLDHQNKDMLLFEGTVGGRYHALTRPLGDLYFSYPPDSEFVAGPSINLATSPDSLHWRPVESPLIRPRRGSTSIMKVGGGSPPIRTANGWLMLYHGVQPGSVTGIYRTFWALLDLEDPATVLEVQDSTPLLESVPGLTDELSHLRYVTGIVFTTGIVKHGSAYIVASGENDLACRITRIPSDFFTCDQTP